MSRRTRAALAAGLGALALAAGLAATPGPGLDGLTFLSLALAIVALDVAAPLLDKGRR